MKKVLIIVSMLLIGSTGVLAQLKSFSGSLGYSHQYTEDLIGPSLWTSRTRTPSVDLSATGILLSDDYAEFELQSFFTQSTMSSRGSTVPVDFGMQNWTIYRLSLSVLQYSPLWILFNTRDGYVRSKADYGSTPGDANRTRSRDQLVTLSLRRISFLPPITVGYNRSRAWTEEGPSSNILSRTYTFSTSASNGSTVLNMTGQTSMVDDLQNNSGAHFSTVQFNGTKSLGSSHDIALQSDYTWYDQIGLTKASLSYRGTPDRMTNLGAGLAFSQTTSLLGSTTTYSANLTAGRAIDEHWRYTLGAGDLSGRLVSTRPEGASATSYNSWRSSAGLSHARTFGLGTMSNSLSVGGEWSSNSENSTTYSAGIANSLTRGIGSTRVAASQSTNVSHVLRFGKEQTQVGNRVDLTADARLHARVSCSTKLAYADSRSVGTFLGEYSTRSVTLNQGLRGTFAYLIPFSLGASFSSNWYFGDVSGTTYGWNVDFSSGAFFADRLSAAYQYNRYYDVRYRIASNSHALQFHYAWRMLSFGLNMYHRSSYSRQRGVDFTVSRPF